MKPALYYNLYLLTEIIYERENTGITKEELFPMDWYSITDYRTKLEILEDAIKNRQYIEDTEKYKNRKEGLRLIR